MNIYISVNSAFRIIMDCPVCHGCRHGPSFYALIPISIVKEEEFASVASVHFLNMEVDCGSCTHPDPSKKRQTSNNACLTTTICSLHHLKNKIIHHHPPSKIEGACCILCVILVLLCLLVEWQCAEEGNRCII